MVKKLTKYCCALLTLGAVEAMDQTEESIKELASPDIALIEIPSDPTPTGLAERLAYFDQLPVMDPLSSETTNLIRASMRTAQKHFALCPTFSYFNEGAKFYNSLNEKYKLKEKPFSYNFTFQNISNAIWHDNFVFIPVMTIVAGATFWLNASLSSEPDKTEPHSYQTDLGTNILPCDSDACKTKYGIICNFKSFNDAMHNVPYSKGGPISFGAPYPSLKINYPLNVAYPECKYHRPQ